MKRESVEVTDITDTNKYTHIPPIPIQYHPPTSHKHTHSHALDSLTPGGTGGSYPIQQWSCGKTQAAMYQMSTTTAPECHRPYTHILWPGP